MRPVSVHYAESDGVDIAYAIYGDGPVTVVLVPGLMGHLDLNHENPYYRPFLERLPAFARLVVFDKAGFGLSGRSRVGTLEEQVNDLRAVIDDAGVEQVVLLGIIEGGPIAMLFAAGFPGRVTSLILHESAARLVRSDDYPDGWPSEIADLIADNFERNWGSGSCLGPIFGGAPNDSYVTTLVGRWERNFGSPRDIARQARLWHQWDVRAALSLISCPTLVLHNRGDPLFPVSGSRYLAERIADARLIELPFDCHVMWDGSSAEAACDEIEAFLGERHTGASSSPTRSLATVLFTDVVGSTDHARRIGDDRWHRVLDELESMASFVCVRLGGRIVKTTGDGVLAVFEGPGRAVTAARQLLDGARPLGLELRVGIHTGEIEHRGDDIGGLAVHLASRIQAQASPQQIVVSRTVTDLTVGSALRYQPLGPRQLKGFEQPWDLYEVVQ